MSSTSTNKRAETDGFSRANMAERISRFEGKYCAQWRKVDTRRVVMTTLLQKFQHTSRVETIIRHICPWGMKDLMTRLLSHRRCLNRSVLPKYVCDDHPLLVSELGYNKSEWTITISNTGAARPAEYHRLYCTYCHSTLIPRVIEEFKAGLEKPTLDNLIANWDILKIPDKYCDYVGCFLPWEPKIQAGPNSRKYIRDQSEHPKTSHIYTVSEDPNKKKLKRQIKLFTVGSTPHKEVTLAPPAKTPKPVSNQSTIVGKTTKKTMRQGSISNFLNVIPLIGEVSTKSHERAKGVCLSVVHKGVNKTLSHSAIIDMYESAYDAQVAYYEGASDYLSEKHPGASIPPVSKVQLNGHNIPKAERAILDTYRYDTEKSLYTDFRKSPYYSILHDGISKFGHELNGVYMRGINDDHKPFSVPFCLNKMKGGVTGMDTAHEILANVATVISSSASAYHTVCESFLEVYGGNDSNYIPPKPPNYFKIGQLGEIDHSKKEITIRVSEKFPVANIGDGVAVNVKAARILRDLFGFFALDFRCIAHCASGTVRRLATSKTMNVQEVTVCYECLRTVIKHFEQSIKNKETLDQAMAILEMTPLHLLSWCQTRMAHFLTSCNIFDDMLAAVYDTMYTKGIRVDERDLLFSPMNVYVLKIMADLHPVFQKNFLRQADKSDLLVSMVYNLSSSFAATLESSVETSSADSFLESLQFDENGNLLGVTKCERENHTMTLNYSHHPSRNTSDTRLNRLKNELKAVKVRIVDNIVDNVRDQCDDQTYFYAWSGLDLELKLSVTERVNRLRDIISVYCTERVHTVQKYRTQKEEDTVADNWEGYQVNLVYPKKINMTEEELRQELEVAFKTISQLYLAEVNAARIQNRRVDQLNVWQSFLNNHFLEFPGVGQLVQILISTASNTSPLERGYTYLEMIAAKRRNKLEPKTIETLFMLASLKLPVKKYSEYAMEVERLKS